MSISEEQCSELSHQMQALMERLENSQYPVEWRVCPVTGHMATSHHRGEHSCQRIVITDSLPEDHIAGILDSDDEADQYLLEGRSGDEHSDGEIDNGSDLDDFIVPDSDSEAGSDDEVEIVIDDVDESGSEDSESGSDVDGSEDEEEVASVEPTLVDQDLDGIDSSNIVQGRRTRRAPEVYLPPNYAALMLRGDDAVEGSLEDSDDELEDSADDDDSEDDESDEDEAVIIVEYADDDTDEEEVIIHKTPSKKNRIEDDEDEVESESD